MRRSTPPSAPGAIACGPASYPISIRPRFDRDFASKTRWRQGLGSRGVGFPRRAAGRMDQLLSSFCTLQTNRRAVGRHRESRHQTVGAQRPAVLSEVVLGDYREPAVLDLRLEILRAPLQGQILAGWIRGIQCAQTSQGSATIAGIAHQYIAGALDPLLRLRRQIVGFG